MDGYNQISWNSNKISIPVLLPQGTEIELHIVLRNDRCEVRLWHKEKILKVIHYTR